MGEFWIILFDIWIFDDFSEKMDVCKLMIIMKKNIDIIKGNTKLII